TLARQSTEIARALLADRGAKAIEQLTLHTGRQFAGAESLLAAAAASGALRGVTGDDKITLVNARARAGERGIAIATVPLQSADDAYGVRVSVRGDGAQIVVGGVAAPSASPRGTPSSCSPTPTCPV